MSDDSQTIGGSSPFPVRVDGLRKVQRALRQAEADMADMSDLMHEIGQIIVGDAHIPVKSGRLLSSLRAGKGKTKAVVRMGGARVPYAGVIEYGRGDSYKGTGKYLNPARERDRGRIISTFERGLKRIIDKNGLSAD
jgi:hypothetical protein